MRQKQSRNTNESDRYNRIWTNPLNKFKTIVQHIHEAAAKIMCRVQDIQTNLNSNESFVMALSFLRNHSFISFVILPLVITFFYLAFIKTPLYESNFRILVEKSGDDNSLMINLGFLGQANDTGNDSKITLLSEEFITSRDMFKQLNEKIDLVGHYSKPDVDYLSRLNRNAKFDQLIQYYEKKVSVNYDSQTNELEISALAFDAAYAQLLAKEIIMNVRVFANKVANTLAYEHFNFAEKQLSQAKEKLQSVEEKILALQSETGMLDPEKALESYSAIMSNLNQKLVEKQTELINFQSYLSERSPKVIALKKEITAIKAEIALQSKTMLASDKSSTNHTLAKFQHLNLDLKFATAEYEASQSAYETARIKLNKQQELVVEISPPIIPDDYHYPDIPLDMLYYFVCLLVVYATTRMAITVVREHTD